MEKVIPEKTNKESSELKNMSQEENRESFLKRFENKLSKEDISSIDFAYDLAKEAHRPTNRDSGERYFEHPRAGCMIITDELGLFEKELIISFLLHDSGEDTGIFGNIKQSYKKFIEKANYRITKLFGEKVTDTVIRLTKPSVDGETFNSKEEVYTFYYQELKKSNDAILLKMVDRLHNLRSLPSNNTEKIRKQILETEQDYFPIFESIAGGREVPGEILINKIKDQLEILKQSLI